MQFALDVAAKCTYIVEAADHSAGADDKGQWVPALTTAVELGAVVQEACVVHLNRVAVGGDAHGGGGRGTLVGSKRCDWPIH